MTTTPAPSTGSMPLIPQRLAEPPPATLELSDGETVVGWVMGAAIGFRGFADEAEAANAAWVACRAMERRRAQADDGRSVPVDFEPLALDRSREPAVILAGGRPIATLVGPGADSRSGSDSFGFELRVPPPADELRVRSTAYVLYQTLRQSGLRWALFTRARPRPVGVVDGRSTTARPSEAGVAPRRPAGDVPTTGRRLAIAGSVGISLLVLGLFLAAWLRAITASSAVGVLGAVAAVFTLGALVQLVLTDLRVTRTPRGSERGRERGRLPAASGGAAARVDWTGPSVTPGSVGGAS